METKPAIDAESTTKSQEKKPNDKRKRSRSNLLKAALYLLRTGSRNSKSANADVPSKDAWKKVVGSMRPMHLQASQSPPHSVHNGDQEQSHRSVPSSDSSMYSVSPASSRYASSENLQELVHSSFYQDSPSSSRYASAQNLQELVSNEKERNENECRNEVDEMIDEKAEMFIAQFYERMRLERRGY